MKVFRHSFQRLKGSERDFLLFIFEVSSDFRLTNPKHLERLKEEISLASNLGEFSKRKIVGKYLKEASEE